MLAQDHGATAAPLQQPRTSNCKNRPKCPIQGNCAKKTWCTKQQLSQKQQRKIMLDSPQISKNGIETIRHPSGTPVKETRPSYRNTSATSKTEKSRFSLSGEF